ncbi:MAG: regulatory protein RecX [Casimicrobiaceae bacterium]
MRRVKAPVSVRASAIRMLARREYGRAELTQRLVRRGAPADEVEGVLNEMQQLGLLSDARYAHSLVTQMSGRYSRRTIEHTMKSQSVEAEAVADVNSELSVIDDAADALALLTRRFPDPPANDREKARQVRFLQSRGYSLSLILRLLRERKNPE